MSNPEAPPLTRAFLELAVLSLSHIPLLGNLGHQFVLEGDAPHSLPKAGRNYQGRYLRRGPIPSAFRPIDGFHLRSVLVKGYSDSPHITGADLSIDCHLIGGAGPSPYGQQLVYIQCQSSRRYVFLPKAGGKYSFLREDWFPALPILSQPRELSKSLCSLLLRSLLKIPASCSKQMGQLTVPETRSKWGSSVSSPHRMQI